MTRLPQKFDNFLAAIQSILMSILIRLGPFCVALMPALFVAYAIFSTFADEAGPRLALFFAITVGLAMETVGIVATHTAIDLYNGVQAKHINPGKYRLMVWMVPIYVVGVAAVVYFSEDAFSPLVKGLGVASPFLTCIVYIAVALARDLANIEARQETKEEHQTAIETDEIRWQREKERLQIELKHSEKLAKIEAQIRAKSAQVYAGQPANSAQIGPGSVPKSEWRETAIELLRENARLTGAELGRQLGASPRTGQNILNELEQAGIIHRNGNGTEVL